MPVKAFISHASEDKARFVERFSELLRAHGIDAWLDQWEMAPGDSLVDRLFSGIKDAEVFIIILSTHSVVKPWVREELNASIVKRIEKKCKIIPILIDDCEVPECLKSTVWLRIHDLNSYGIEAKRIINAILGINLKPPLGEPPVHASTIVEDFPNLTKGDAIVLSAACAASMNEQDSLVSTNQLYPIVEKQGLSEEEIDESLKVLLEQGELSDPGWMHGYIIHFNISHHSFEEYLKHIIPDYKELVKSICVAIVNVRNKSNWELRVEFHQPLRVINHIMDGLVAKNLIQQIKIMGGRRQVVEISPRLSRIIDG
jgi:hypothetical protein